MKEHYLDFIVDEIEKFNSNILPELCDILESSKDDNYICEIRGYSLNIAHKILESIDMDK